MTGRRAPGSPRAAGKRPDQAQAAVLQQLARVLDEPVLAAQPPATRKLAEKWSAVSGSGALVVTAALFGIYLAYAVLRLQEIYPDLDIPRLPMIMSLIIVFVVLASTPAIGWKTMWAMVPPVRWQVLIIVLSVITAPIGIRMGGSLHFVAERYSISLIVFFASIVLLRDRRAMAAALTVLLIAGAVVAAYSMSPTAQTIGRGLNKRVEVGVTLDPNDLAQLFVVLVPLALFMAQRRGLLSVHWFVVAGMMVIAIIPTQSRGAIVGIGAVALVLLSFGTSRWRRVINIVGVAAGAVGLMLAAKGPGGAHLDDFSDYSGGEGRIAIWKRGLVWMTWRPWGYGIDNFPLYFGWLNGPDRAAHNSFIQIGMELGVTGGIAFIMVWFLLIRGLLQQRAHAIRVATRIPAAGREAMLTTMMLAAIAGTMVTGFFLAKAYDGITLFIQGLGCAVLLGYPFRNESAPVAAPALTSSQLRRTRTLQLT